MGHGKILESHVNEMREVLTGQIKPQLEMSHEDIKKAVADLKGQGFTFGSAEITENYVNAVANLEAAVEEIGELGSMIDSFNVKIAGVLQEVSSKAKTSTDAALAQAAEAKNKANS